MNKSREKELDFASSDLSDYLSKKTGKRIDAIGRIESDLYGLVIPVDELIYDPYQTQEHDQRSISEIKRSFSAHGQKKPIVIERSTGVIKAGNGTVEAVKDLGWTHIAAVRSDDLESDLRAYAMDDNRTSQFSKWIGEKVISELSSLNIKPEDAGWTPSELANIAPINTELEIINTTDTNRDGQGMQSTLSSMNTASKELIKVGELSIRIKKDKFDMFLKYLRDNFDKGISYPDSFENMIDGVIS